MILKLKRETGGLSTVFPFLLLSHFARRTHPHLYCLASQPRASAAPQANWHEAMLPVGGWGDTGKLFEMLWELFWLLQWICDTIGTGRGRGWGKDTAWILISERFSSVKSCLAFCRIFSLSLFCPPFLFLSFFLFLFLAVLSLSCMQDLIPWPGMEPGPPALEVQSLSYWTTREVPCMIFKCPTRDSCWEENIYI